MNDTTLTKPFRYQVRITHKKSGVVYWQTLHPNKKPQKGSGKTYRTLLIDNNGITTAGAQWTEKKIKGKLPTELAIGRPTSIAGYEELAPKNGVTAEEKQALLDRGWDKVHEIALDATTIRANIDKLLNVLHRLRESDMLSSSGYDYARNMVSMDMTGREAGEIVTALRDALK